MSQAAEDSRTRPDSARGGTILGTRTFCVFSPLRRACRMARSDDYQPRTNVIIGPNNSFGLSAESGDDCGAAVPAAQKIGAQDGRRDARTTKLAESPFLQRSGRGTGGEHPGFRATGAPGSNRSASSLTPHPSSLVLHPSSFILHPSSFIPHPSSLILHPTLSVWGPRPPCSSRSLRCSWGRRRPPPSPG